jgi:choline kinase
VRGVILAAGRGSRMLPLTKDRPKCLIELDGASLLDRQVAAFRLASVLDLAVVTGWRGDRFSRMGLTVFSNPNWATSTMVDSLACAEEWLVAGPVVVAYGDIIFSPQAVEVVLASEASITIVYDPNWLELWSRRFDDPLSDAETFRIAPGEIVTEIGGRPRSLDEITGQYLGLFKLEPAGWRVMSAVLSEAHRRRVRLDMTAVLSRLISEGQEVRGVPVSGPWYEFDSTRDIAIAQPVLAGLDKLLFGQLPPNPTK